MDNPKLTNADRFRNRICTMSVEELAELVSGSGCPDGYINTWLCDDMSCIDCWLGWLKEEVEE